MPIISLHSRILVASASLALVCLCACDPAVLTRLRVTPRHADDGGGAASAFNVTASSVDAVVSIVRDVAERHGLARAAVSDSDDMTTYSRRWDRNGDGHARSISVSVSRRSDNPDLIEVSVFEWLAFGHSALGEQVLEELRSRLREQFGHSAVSRADQCGTGSSANEEHAADGASRRRLMLSVGQTGEHAGRLTADPEPETMPRKGVSDELARAHLSRPEGLPRQAVRGRNTGYGVGGPGQSRRRPVRR